MKKFVKGLKIAANVILWAFLIFAMLTTVIVISSTKRSDGIPVMLGKIMITVESDSMKPVFSKGDIIFDTAYGTASEVRADVKVDDVITYFVDLDGNGEEELNTHRVISIVTNENGTATYKTQGDNNDMPDSYDVSESKVVGKYAKSRVPALGSVLSFLRTSTGFFCCIIIPLLLFFIYELYSFIRTLVKIREEKVRAEGVSADVEEAIRQKAIEDYLKEQQAKAEEAKGDDKPDEKEGK